MTRPNMNHQEIGYQIANLNDVRTGVVHGFPAEQEVEAAVWDAAISAAKRREAAAEEVRWKLAIARAHQREEATGAFYRLDPRRWTRAEKIARNALGRHRVMRTEAFPQDCMIQVWLERGLRATFADLDALHQVLGTSSIDLLAVRGGHREETWNPYRSEVVAFEIRDLAAALFEVC